MLDFINHMTLINFLNRVLRENAKILTSVLLRYYSNALVNATRRLIG